MGQSYANIVGDITTFPSIYSYEIKWVLDLLERTKANAIPVLREQIRYIRQDAAGSSTGGGGDGLTIATAFKCRHMADVRTLVANTLTTGMAILFRCGDTFYAADSNSDQGIQAAGFGNYSFGSYVDPAAPSTEKPRLLGFKKVTAIGVTGDGVNFTFTDATQAYWVRARKTGSDPVRGFRNIAYDMAIDAADVANKDRSFWWASGTITTRMGTAGDVDDPTTLEAAVATGAGITITNQDGVRIDGLIIEGWGLNDPDGNGACIGGSINGTKETLISNCELGWGPYHSGLFFTSSGAGGYVTAHKCSFGYFTIRSSAAGGGGDSCVVYNPNGGQELVMIEPTWWGAGMRRFGVAGAEGSTAGSPCYMHASTLTNIGFYIRYRAQMVLPANVRVRWLGLLGAADSLVTYGSGGAVSKATGVAAGFDQRQYRFWTVDEVSDAPPPDSTMNGVHINPTRTHLTPPTAGPVIIWGVSTNYLDPLEVNPVHIVALTGAWAGKGLYLTAHSAGTVNRRWTHPELRIVASAGMSSAPSADFFHFEGNAARNDNFAIFNGIVSQNVVANGTDPLALRNAPAAFNSGGITRCAFFGCPASSFNGTGTRSITLAAAQTYPVDASSRSRIPAALVGAADRMTDNIRLEYDRTWARRPTTPTVGPLEARPVTTPAIGPNGNFQVISDRVVRL